MPKKAKTSDVNRLVPVGNKEAENCFVKIDSRKKANHEIQELLYKTAEIVSTYHKSLFETIIAGLLVRNGGGRISAPFRHFGKSFL